MRVITVMGGLLTVAALAACDSQIAPDVTTGPATWSTTQQRGARLAADLCASCHGATFEGATIGGSTCPALERVADYSLGDFTRLITTGVTRDRRNVRATMQAPNALHSDEIADLYAFFLAYDAR